MTGRMLVKLLLLLMLSEVLLFSVSEAKPWFSRRRRRRHSPPSPPPCDSSTPSGIKWSNNWHQAFNVRCPPGSSLSQWKSIHRDCKGDRIHHFKCTYSLVSGCICGGSVQSNFGQPLNFTCPFNGVITGVESQYSGTYRDRWFRFHCCVNGYGYKAQNCESTPYKNVFDGDLDYMVESGRYLVGVSSDYDSNYQDRRWKFRYCKFSKY